MISWSNLIEFASYRKVVEKEKEEKAKKKSDAVRSIFFLV